MRRTGRLAGLAAIALLLAAPTALGQSGSISVSNAWVRRAQLAGESGSEDSMGSGGHAAMGHSTGDATSAVYATLGNSGSRADALVSASSDVARSAELHRVENDAGVMRMRPVKSIPLPPGEKVELAPGGYHIMLIGLVRALDPGDSVRVTLEFEHAGPLQVDATVR